MLCIQHNISSADLSTGKDRTYKNFGKNTVLNKNIYMFGVLVALVSVVLYNMAFEADHGDAQD